MEARERPTGDGDEQEREEVAGEGRAVRLAGQHADPRHADLRIRNGDADDEQRQCADLHQCGQVVARGHQQPVLQRCGRERVDNERDDELLGVEREDGCERRVRNDPATADNGEHQQHKTEDGGLDDLARPQEALIAAHDQRDWDRHAQGEHGPRRACHGLDGDEREERHRNGGDHDEEQRDDDATELAHLISGHLAEGTALSFRRDPQHEHVLHGAGEDHAEDDPQDAWQVAHLRRQNRSDKRSSSGDRRKMLSEEHTTVRPLEVRTVMHALRRCGVRVVGAHDLDLDAIRIETVGDGIRAQRHDDEPDGADLFAARHRQNRPADRADNGDKRPRHRLLPRPYHLRPNAGRQSVPVTNDSRLLGVVVCHARRRFRCR